MKSPIVRRCKAVAVSVWLVFAAVLANAGAPSLQWTNNVGARVFAIDAQTNVFASASNAVLKINPAGSVVLTLLLTNRPGMTQRDAAEIPQRDLHQGFRAERAGIV